MWENTCIHFWSDRKHISDLPGIHSKITNLTLCVVFSCDITKVKSFKSTRPKHYQEPVLLVSHFQLSCDLDVTKLVGGESPDECVITWTWSLKYVEETVSVLLKVLSQGRKCFSYLPSIHSSIADSIVRVVLPMSTIVQTLNLVRQEIAEICI